jgi:hypothetical protein
MRFIETPIFTKILKPPLDDTASFPKAMSARKMRAYNQPADNNLATSMT